jgi:hypothetical protein
MERVLALWAIIVNVSTWDNGSVFPEGLPQDSSPTRVQEMDDRDLLEFLGYEERWPHSANGERYFINRRAALSRFGLI